jgi:hypothetical protein
LCVQIQYQSHQLHPLWKIQRQNPPQSLILHLNLILSQNPNQSLLR